MKFAAAGGRPLQPHREDFAPDRVDSSMKVGGVDAFVPRLQIADQIARGLQRIREFGQPARTQGGGIFIRNSTHPHPQSVSAGL